MKTKLLAAVASFAFVAAGVVAHAQDAQHHEGPAGAAHPGPAQHMEPNRAPAGQPAPRAEGEGPSRADQGAAEPASRPEGPRNAEAPRQVQPNAPRNAEGENRNAPRNAEGENRNAPRNAEGDNRNAPRNAEGENRNAPRNAEGENRNAPRNAEGENRNAPRNAEGENRNAPRNAEGENHNAPRSVEGAAPSRIGPRTAGQPRVVGRVQTSTEHANRVTQLLRREGRHERPNFAVDVGSRIPEGFEVYPLPPEVIAIAPEYRGYDYFIDDDEIVFVQPESHEIVGEIEYEGRAADEDSVSVRPARPCPVEN